jgi:hypothetical protein
LQIIIFITKALAPLAHITPLQIAANEEAPTDYAQDFDDIADVSRLKWSIVIVEATEKRNTVKPQHGVGAQLKDVSFIFQSLHALVPLRSSLVLCTTFKLCHMNAFMIHV